MITFSDWKILTHLEQEKQISALLLASCYDGNYIYRPLKHIDDVILEISREYKQYILKKYPNGEYIAYIKQPITYETYNLLYHWITGACINCFSYSIVWDKNDFCLSYYCRYCGKLSKIATYNPDISDDPTEL